VSDSDIRGFIGYSAIVWLFGFFGGWCGCLLFNHERFDEPAKPAVMRLAAYVPVNTYVGSAAPIANAAARPAAAPAKAKPTWSGTVLSVGDGDTYWIEHDSVPVKVRAADGDSPEVSRGKRPGQPFGKQAQAYAAQRILGKKVGVVFRDWYFYGQGEIVAEVWIEDTNLTAEMIEQGLMWHYAAYSKDKALAMRQQQAKAFKKGLWSDPHAQAPWDFRRSLKKKAA
jgi:micrococcal nuclease